MSKNTDKGSSASFINLYNRFFEYERVVTHVEVTDEGIYQVGEIPDSYGGANLTLQMVNAVFMVNSRAELILLEFETQSPMDKNRKSGGPIVRDGVNIRAKSGDSSVNVVQTTVANGALDSTRKSLGAAAKSQFLKDLAAQPDQPKS